VTLAAGTRLGPYEILSPLGAGGMGEVYRARDTRLGRDVAIKVLPAHLGAHPEVRARFEREARAVSSLNHPNICVLYDVGRERDIDYLVLELIEGETLAARLQRGPLAAPEVLTIAAQIAAALDRAHRAGVVHRDLKPGNVMLTKTGAKLMDFGLARAMAESAPSGTTQVLAESPTKARSLTSEGALIGTFQYMAPEQLEGKEADARSDIWSFGAMLYEMATGKRAFEGGSQASLISSILRDTPRPIGELVPMSPPALERVVMQCLAKDPDDRWQNAGDLGRELQWIAGAKPEALTPAQERPAGTFGRRLLMGWAVLATIAFIAAIGALRSGTHAPLTGSMRLMLPPLEGGKISVEPADLAISPDGTRIVFCVADSTGKQQLWIEALSDAAPRPLPETESAYNPFWSPDGRSIAFFTLDEPASLKKMSAGGGSPVTLCPVEWGRGGAWGKNGDIVFAPAPEGPLMRISAEGGPVTVATQLDTTRHETTQRFPSFLPDGEHFVYASLPAVGEGWYAMLASLRSQETKRLLKAESAPTFAAPNFLIFDRDGKLVAQRLDLGSLEMKGDVFPVGDAPGWTDTDATSVVSASLNGRLAVLHSVFPLRHVEAIGRSGASAGRCSIPAGYYFDFYLSPDERSLSLAQQTQRACGDIERVDIERGVVMRLTDSRYWIGGGVWSPDGKRLAITSSTSGRDEIYVLPSDGTGAMTLVPTLSTQFKTPRSWSPDGRYVAFEMLDSKTSFDIYRVAMDGKNDVHPLVTDPGAQEFPRISPDGRWLLYQSTPADRPDVFLVPFPEGGARIQVSTEGGRRPAWSQDGKEILFLNRGAVYSVPFSGEAAARLTPPRFLCRTPTVPLLRGENFVWTASRDGQRFYFIVPDAPRDPSVMVLLDWPGLIAKQ
jgi:eukaryotic-like serine/threonine-protein kinase